MCTVQWAMNKQDFSKSSSNLDKIDQKEHLIMGSESEVLDTLTKNRYMLSTNFYLIFFHYSGIDGLLGTA